MLSDFSPFALFTAGLSLFAPLAAAYTAPVGNPTGNPISKPGLNEIVPVGEPYTVTWNPTTPGTVTLVLLRGPSENIQPLYPIAEGIENTGTFSWTPSTDLEDDVTHYGIQLIVDSSGQYQYTTQFGVSNPNKATTSSASSSSSSAGGSSAAPTTVTSTLAPASTSSTESPSTSSAPDSASSSMTPTSSLPETSSYAAPMSSMLSTLSSVVVPAMPTGSAGVYPSMTVPVNGTSPTTTGGIVLSTGAAGRREVGVVALIGGLMVALL